MPKEFTVEWLIEQTVNLVKKHQGLILRPATDLTIVKQYLVLIIDGWHPLTSQEQEELGDSDEAEEEQDVKKVDVYVPPKIEDWGCLACTFINPISCTSCTICGSARPSLEAL